MDGVRHITKHLQVRFHHCRKMARSIGAITVELQNAILTETSPLEWDIFLLIDSAVVDRLLELSCHVAAHLSRQLDGHPALAQPHHVSSTAPDAGRSRQISRTANTFATMLLLDYQNVLIQSVLTERFSGFVRACAG